MVVGRSALQAETRYRDMASLAADLRAHLEHRVVRAHGGGVVAAVQKWVRRNRSAAAALAVGLVVAVAGSAWFVDRLAAARDAASASLREVLDLAVVEQVEDLRRRADRDLWPLDERRAPELRTWLVEAECLRGVHERLRDRQRAGGAAQVDVSASNLSDATSAEALGTQAWAPTKGLRDGYVMHAPIGSFPPNPFALHDMIGNVAEWCLDEYVSHTKPPVDGTGARPLSDRPGTVMYRGGALDEPAQEARSANRAGGPPERRHFSLGARAARAVAR